MRNLFLPHSHFLIPYFLFLIFLAPANAHEGHQPLPTKGVQVDTDRGYITLSGQARDAIGLETAEVSQGDVALTLFAYAEAVAPWDAKAFGSAQISGRITKLLVSSGDSVVKGQVVAELSSREFEALQLDYSQAKQELALNKQLIDLTRPSAQAGAVPMQRLLELENAYQQSENSVVIARLRARTLGVEADALDQISNQPIQHLIRSPISGKVIHSDLSEGKFVEAFEHLFEIVNNERTWVRLQVLEKDSFNIAIGQHVDIEFADAAVKVVGTIDRIDAGLEPKTQVTWAWVTVSHPSVVPGLVGSAQIHISTQADRLAVPQNSIYSDGLQTYVFVEEAATKSSAEYRKRSVRVGDRKLIPSASNAPIVEILRGDIYPGDRVVIKGGRELSSLFFLGVLKLSEADRQRLGILTATATHRSIGEVIPIAASITLPPDRRSVASSQVAGTIHSHTLSPGKEIRVGDLLMEIASPEFQALQLDLLRTTLDANLSRVRATRLEEVNSDAFSRRVLLETLAKAKQLEGRAESLERQLISLGLTAAEVQSVVREKKVHDFLPVRAAIDGRLTKWLGTLGETIVANEALVEIQDLKSIWIEAHAPPHLVRAISTATAGKASVLSNSLIQFPVNVSRVGPTVSETTRTQPIWLTTNFAQEQNLPNPTHERGTVENPSLTPRVEMLRDGMQVTVSLKMAEGQPVLAVPETAVLRDGLHYFVFVQKPDDYVERRRVTIGRSDGEWTEIRNGIVAGEAVVSAGGRELQTAFASLR